MTHNPLSIATAGLAMLLAARLAGPAQTADVAAAADAPAGAPPCVLICGDSVMKLLGMSLERALNARGGVRVVTFTSIGSGLARLDLFDWIGQVRALAAKERPRAAVILLGSNDNQPMQTPAGAPLAERSPAWVADYTTRVQAVLAAFRESGVRTVLWMGLPDMRDPALQQHVNLLNPLFAEQVRADAHAVYFDTPRVFSRSPGTFTMYLIGPDGMPVTVRSSDGIHLNRAGADRLAREVLRALDEHHVFAAPAAAAGS